MPIDSENGEIRLLELAPGVFEDEIEINLVHSNLSNSSRSYEALSYVWGTELAPSNALLNGNPTTITSNLDSALRHLRGTIVRRTLWVDALSMNQKDTQERNHQVRMMGKIYSSAQGVIVWLGPVDLADLHLRAVLGAMQFQFASGTSFTATLFDYMCSVVTLMHEQANECINAEGHVLDAIHCIISRPWFSRSWVVQELALAQRATIRIGTFGFPWEPFEFFIQWLPDHKADIDSRPELVKAARMVAKMACSRSFSTQLLRTMHLSATDPRDKVFGILGISSFQNTNIEPDYTKSTQQVYIDAACRALHDDKLAMYYFAPLQAYSDAPSITLDKLSGMPSWIPDFSIEGATYVENVIYGQAGSAVTYSGKADHRPFTILYSSERPWRAKNLFHAMIHRLPFAPLHISVDNTRLLAPGIPIGTITKTSGRLLWNMDPDESLSGLPQSIRNLWHSFAEPEGIQPPNFLAVLLKPRSNLVWFEKYRREAALGLFPPTQMVEEPSFRSQLATETLVEDMKANTRNRIFYMTDNGAFGLTYHPNPDDGVRPGDVVVGLFGIKFPFILRPNSDTSYTMINVAGVDQHRWGHDFLRNTEDIMISSDDYWGDSIGVARSKPTATWKDYEEYGMKEYVIV
ncbi:heterokaryon incompatibility protein-domain-containing protein [Phaeosphaeria sp. MPI-PUGE-AT-0046c]|nr:heterokaryon incompatibility protein-domain-containing protein [Phaeosphaeria sp. MPI-PUGE-AT-0046c]